MVNGFDEHAVEAALRIKDAAGDTRITVPLVGASFSLDVMKEPLAMGADELLLLQDDAFENVIDPTTTVRALAAAIRSWAMWTWSCAAVRPPTGTTRRCPWGSPRSWTCRW